ncbi:membrane protein [Gordonia phage Camerico]|nr:membrane protein [Gordonia phage Camerico]
MTPSNFDDRIPTGPTTGVNLFNIRSWNDFVAMLYVIVPILSISLVGYGVLDSESSAVLVGAILAVLQTILQFARTAEWRRKIFYTVLLATNAVLVWWKVIDPGFLDQWLPLINVLLVGAPAAVAVQNVNTTGDNVVQLPRAA